MTGELTTDANGYFNFGGLGPGTYQLRRAYRFTYPGGQSSRSVYLATKTIELASGQHEEIDFALPKGQNVSVTVVDENGKPAGDCLVQINGATPDDIHAAAKSSAQGKCEITHIPDGKWTISVQQFGANGRYSYRPTGNGSKAITVAGEPLSIKVEIAPPEAAKQQPGLFDRLLNAFGN